MSSQQNDCFALSKCECDEEKYTIKYYYQPTEPPRVMEIKMNPYNSVAFLKSEILSSSSNNVHEGVSVYTNINELYLMYEKCVTLTSEGIYQDILKECGHKKISEYNLNSYLENLKNNSSLDNKKGKPMHLLCSSSNTSLENLCIYNEIVSWGLNDIHDIMKQPMGVEFMTYLPYCPLSPNAREDSGSPPIQTDKKRIIDYGNIYKNTIHAYKYNKSNEMKRFYFPSLGNPISQINIPKVKKETKEDFNIEDYTIKIFAFSVQANYPVYIDLKNLFHTIKADNSIPYIRYVFGSSNVMDKKQDYQVNVEIKSYCEYYDKSHNKIPVFDTKVLKNIKIANNIDEVQFFIPLSDKPFDLCYIINSEGEQKIYAFKRKSKKIEKPKDICNEINTINILVKSDCSIVYDKCIEYLKSIGQFGVQPLNSINVYDENVQMNKLVMKPKDKKNGDKDNINVSRRVRNKKNCIFVSNNKKNNDSDKIIVSNNMNIMNWLCNTQYNYTLSGDIENEKEDDEETSEEEDVQDVSSGDETSVDESSSSSEDEDSSSYSVLIGGESKRNVSGKSTNFLVSSIKVKSQEGIIKEGDTLIMDDVYINDKKDNVKFEVVNTIIDGDSKLITDQDALFASVQKGCDYKELYLSKKDKRNISKEIKLKVKGAEDECYALADIEIKAKNDSFHDILEGEKLLSKKFSSTCTGFAKQPYVTRYGKNIFDITGTNEVIRIDGGKILMITKAKVDNKDGYTYRYITVGGDENILENETLEEFKTKEMSYVQEWSKDGIFMFFCGYNKVDNNNVKRNLFYTYGTPIINKKKDNKLLFCGVTKKYTDKVLKNEKNNFAKQLRDTDKEGPLNTDSQKLTGERQKIIETLDSNGEENKEYNITGKVNNTYKACLEKIYTSTKEEGNNVNLEGKKGDDLISELKKYIKADESEKNKEFLNLQNGDLFTVFSDLNSLNGSTIEGVKNKYVSYLEGDDISYNYVWDIMEKAFDIKIIIIESDNMVCPNVLYNSSHDFVNSLQDEDAFYSTYLILKFVNNEGSTYYNISTKGKGSSEILKFDVKKKVLQYLLRDCVPSFREGDKMVKPFVLKELMKIIKSKSTPENKITLNKYFLSPLSHKVIGVDVGIDVMSIYIPCYPSSIPINDNINSGYDTPPMNGLKDIIHVVELLRMEIQCSVRDKDDNIIGLYVTDWELFIPCKRINSDYDLNTLNNKLNLACKTRYTTTDNPYNFDKNLSESSSNDYDDDRIIDTKNILAESRMYSEYRVAMKVALNCLTGCTETSEDILDERTKILNSVIDYMNSSTESSVINKNNYKNSMKTISKILEGIYDNSVETVDAEAERLAAEKAEAELIAAEKARAEHLGEDISSSVFNSLNDEDISSSVINSLYLPGHDRDSNKTEKSSSGISSNSIENAANILSSQKGGMKDVRKILVTKFNQLSGDENSKIMNKNLYTHKLADELLRYPRIRNFILGPDSSIPFKIVPLTLSDNEEIFDSDASYKDEYNKVKYMKIGKELNTTFDTVRKT